jgi:hypothetical protein
MGTKVSQKGEGRREKGEGRREKGVSFSPLSSDHVISPAPSEAWQV